MPKRWRIALIERGERYGVVSCWNAGVVGRIRSNWGCLMKNGAERRHLFLLDILRGLASIAVIIFHYQQFYFIGTSTPTSFSYSQEPFYWAFWALYNEGWRAVELFFALSGFIFFYQYEDQIRSKSVGVYKFFVLRFSRLYPLHFATLLLVAVGQFISTSIDGKPIVYGCNDTSRFLLNIVFATDWLPRRWQCLSFNGPVWSLSVETFLYILFFVFALMLPNRWSLRVVACLCLVSLGAVVHFFDGFPLLGAPLVCFYSGGIACLLWQRMNEKRWPIASTAAIAAATLSLAIAISFFHFTDLVLYAIVFTTAIFLLVVIQDAMPTAGLRIRLVGDISYSTYLIHFPVTLLLMLLNKTGWTNFNFSLRSTWILYFALVIVAAVPTHYWFERSTQKHLRRQLLPTSSELRSERRETGRRAAQ
jgi:peptidoglycan/LPS O-acetylase OafA/YrhL